MGKVLVFGKKAAPQQPQQPAARKVPPAQDMSWLNTMLSLVCKSCQHEWMQPREGACPKCHSTETQVVLARHNELPRV